MKNGALTPAERAREKAARDMASGGIAKAAHNGVNGNPLSASSQRTQANVQRNLDQQRRIEAGVRNGSLTKREIGSLARGQARVAHSEFVSGRDRRVSAADKARVQRAEKRQSARNGAAKH